METILLHDVIDGLAKARSTPFCLLRSSLYALLLGKKLSPYAMYPSRGEEI
jgi:hypothetical protein